MKRFVDFFKVDEYDFPSAPRTLKTPYFDKIVSF